MNKVTLEGAMVVAEKLLQWSKKGDVEVIREKVKKAGWKERFSLICQAINHCGGNFEKAAEHILCGKYYTDCDPVELGKQIGQILQDIKETGSVSVPNQDVLAEVIWDRRESISVASAIEEAQEKVKASYENSKKPLSIIVDVFSTEEIDNDSTDSDDDSDDDDSDDGNSDDDDSEHHVGKGDGW